MAEYTNVEKPFLDKLRQAHWQVIDQGQGVPVDPRKSMRNSFGEVALKAEFMRSVGDLNTWATQAQLEYCYERILLQGNKKLLEANKNVFRMIRKGITLPGKNMQTGKENPTVKLVDFENGHTNRNSFIAINQFRVDTPTTAKSFIIPDIVCFVNGMPWIVIECKDLYTAEPLSDAFTQIRRYSNQRDDDYYAIDEGKESLFYTNLFNVITHGTEARFGAIRSEFDYYNNWIDIFPEKYKTVDTGKDGQRQEVIILGMFNHEILLDIFHNFTIYMEARPGLEVKIICRYQQYRAVGKMIEGLQNGESFQDRSGVVWHTQGSGKSLTMVFLIKKMRDTFQLKDYKILMVVDRIDLESQLEETAHLAGEKVWTVSKKEGRASHGREEKVLAELGDDTADLNIVMVHKFGINQDMSADALFRLGVVPRFETFGELSKSEKVLILVDEAHRSQNGDMSNNLFMAFPQATRIGFTGTPLITPRHKITTAERFYQKTGEYIDTYKMNDAVADRATVDIKYIGKSTSDEISDKEVFDLEYEEIFKHRTEEERQEIQRRYGGMIEYLESMNRVKPIARDIMEHYVSEILSNGFKAMVVSSSITAVARYKVELERLIPEFLAEEEAKTEEERNEELIKRLKILKVRAVISMQSNNEPPYITLARKEGFGKGITDSFKKDFNTEDSAKSDTGIGILCVCDRLLTGFDAPIAQVLYMDKNLREHDLLQAIARVNRTKKGKTHGLVVDYFGITKNLNRALGIYTDADAEECKDDLIEFGEYFKDINKEIPELELRYRKIVQFFEVNKIPDMDAFLSQTITDPRYEFKIVEDVIEMAGNLKLRAEFDTLIKNYFDRLDLLFNAPTVQREHWIPAKRIGYLMWRIRYHYKDDTLDLRWASAKVRHLIDKYLVHIGITERVEEVSILSEDFPLKIDNLYRGSKSKASAMEHAIRQQIKVKLENNDPALYRHFKDRLDNILNTYQGNWDMMIVELEELRKEATRGRIVDYRIPRIQAPFMDLMTEVLEEEKTPELEQKIIDLTGFIFRYIKEGLQIANFWEKNDEKKKLAGQIEQRIRLCGIASLKSKNKDLATQMMMLAKNNYSEILNSL
jgi:type I restriction enzyme R subunit